MFFGFFRRRKLHLIGCLRFYFCHIFNEEINTTESIRDTTTIFQPHSNLTCNTSSNSHLQPFCTAGLEDNFIIIFYHPLCDIVSNAHAHVINCQAQRSWLALISVYYRPPTATRNSLKMANLAHIEGRMDLNIKILTSLNQLQLALACLSLAQLCPSLFS